MPSLWHLQKRMLFPFESDNKFDASCTKKFLYRRNIAGASKEQSRVKSESRRWIQRGLNRTLRENLPWDECQDRKGYTNLVLSRAPTGRLTTVDNTRQCSGKIRTFRAERVRPSPTCNCSGTFLAPGLSAHHPHPPVHQGSLCLLCILAFEQFFRFRRRFIVYPPYDPISSGLSVPLKSLFPFFIVSHFLLIPNLSSRFSIANGYLKHYFQ